LKEESTERGLREFLQRSESNGTLLGACIRILEGKFGKIKESCDFEI